MACLRALEPTLPAVAIALVLAAGCATIPATKARKESAAVVFHHGRVYGRPGATAVLVVGSRIEKVGGEDLLAWTAAESVDVGGGLIVPGFHDGHVHLMSGGLSLGEARLDGATTLEETLQRIGAWAKEHPTSAWVKGRGFSYDIVPKGTLPTAQMLDRAVRDRPAVIEAYDGHTSWLNTEALARARITRETRDPADGEIARDAAGDPAGALLEGASALLEGVVPEPSRDEKRAALLAAAKACARLGITTVDAIEEAESWELLLELGSELPIRVNVILPIEGDLSRYAEMRAQGTDRVQLIGVKGFVDGVVESKTAFMLSPYEGSSERGRALIPPERLYALVAEAKSKGLLVALHSIGDAAVRLSLDALERAQAPGRVEHIEVLDPADIPRFRKIGAIASMQPYHAVPSEPDPDAGAWSENLGADRRRMSFAWRALLDGGAALAFGSDWPVYTQDPLHGLAVAVTRQNEHALPVGGWNGAQRITIEEAIRAYTDVRTIAEGQPADLVVLPPAIQLDAPATLWTAHPTLVVAGGKIVHAQP